MTMTIIESFRCPKQEPRVQEPFPELSERQREVAMYLAEGRTTREIADVLGISQKTIDTHRANALKRTNTRNAVELARYAIRMGWVAA